jgi:hypothetical protein
MAIKQGSYERVLIYKEVTRGTTPGTLAGHVMPLYDRGFDLFEEAPQDVYELNGTPIPGQPGRGVLKAEGTLTVPIDEVGIGLWLKLMLAGYSKSGAGDPYSHVFTVSSSEPDSFGVELGNTAAAKFDKIPGCAVRGISLVAEKTPAKLTATIDLIGCIGGAPALKAGTSVDATPDVYTTDRYNLFPSLFKIGGSTSAYVQRVTLNIKREVEARHVLDGLRYPKYCSFGGISIDGEVTAIWDDADTIRELAMSSAGASGTEQDLGIVFSGIPASRSLTFDMDECLVFVPSAPGLGGRGARQITVGFKSFYGNDADSPLTATLINGIADYAAIWTASA